MYLCNNCNCFIANSSDQLYKHPIEEGQQLKYKVITISFSTYKAIDNFKEDQFKKFEQFSHLYCRICNQEIGMRIGKDYSLYKCCIQEASNQINIGVYSLKEELFNKLTFDDSLHFYYQPLLRKELNNVQLIQNVQGAIIIHQIEQRLLLLGKNGLYNDLVQKIWKQTCGNVLLILYDTNNINQEELINNLSNEGEQPLIGELYQSQNLVFYNEHINQQIKRFAAKSYNPIYPVEIIKKEEDVSNEKYLLLTYYLERYKQLEYPTIEDKNMLSLIKKSRKQLEFECIII